MAQFKLHIRFWPTVGALAALCLFISLGHWQYGKSLHTEAEAIERETRGAGSPLALPDKIAAPDNFAYLKISVTGRFVRDYQFYLDNRQQDGVPGYEVITPLKPNNSDDWILVNRGWKAWPNGVRGVPMATVPEGEVHLVGLGQIPSTKAFFMMPNQGNTEGLLRMKINLPEFSAWAQHAVHPIVLEELSGTEDELSRNWPKPEDRTLMHRGYAFQWWGMALVTVLFYLYTLVRPRGLKA